METGRPKKYKLNSGDIGTSKRGSNSLQQSLKTLKRKAPEYYDKVCRKEMSANKAMIEAGLRFKTIQIPLVAEKTAERL